MLKLLFLIHGENYLQNSITCWWSFIETISIKSPNEIAAFCGCIISDIYLDGICEERSFDELIMHFSKENNYTPTQIIDEWNEEIGG